MRIVNQKKYDRATRKVNYLYKKACKERDEKGYRENLGYDYIHELESYMSNMDMHYTDECRVKDYFFNCMDMV